MTESTNVLAGMRLDALGSTGLPSAVRDLICQVYGRPIEEEDERDLAQLWAVFVRSTRNVLLFGSPAGPPAPDAGETEPVAGSWYHCTWCIGRGLSVDEAGQLRIGATADGRFIVGCPRPNCLRELANLSREELLAWLDAGRKNAESNRPLPDAKR